MNSFKNTTKQTLLSFGSKLLSKVDLPNVSSHQHEISVPSLCRKVFEPVEMGPGFADFFFLSGTESTSVKNIETFYYNVRQGKKRAPEYRLYYSNEIDEKFSKFSSGDLCIFIKTINHDILILIANRTSQYFSELITLFPLESLNDQQLFLFTNISMPLQKLLGFSNYYSILRLSDYEFRKQEPIGSKDKWWYSSINNPKRLFLLKNHLDHMEKHGQKN